MVNSGPLIRSVHLRNFLSFGADGPPLTLQSLNVLIGPNASGKSNFIEALGLLGAAPTDLVRPIREGGGVRDWLWKGSKETPTAEIEAIIDYPSGVMPLRHRLAFTMVGQRFELIDEAVENEWPDSPEHNDVRFFYRYQRGRPAFNVRERLEESPGAGARTMRQVHREDLEPDQSVLSQRKDPDRYPEITYLADRYGRIRLFREWALGRFTEPRRPQTTDLPEDYLLENFSNLGLVVNDLQHGPAGRVLAEKLRLLSDRLEDVSIRVHGGTVQIYFDEGLSEPVPATRASDGTLHFLALVTLLCHPDPPPVLCIEEPELGLHPDLVPTVAELLVDAASRSQLIVTTHSDALVDALSETPESVLVCEKRENATQISRLDPTDLRNWLEHYRLGTLWRRGDLGGNRW